MPDGDNKFVMFTCNKCMQGTGPSYAMHAITAGIEENLIIN